MQFIADENMDNFVVYRFKQSAISPFEKESFAQYRDWEESLIEFMTEQAKNPNLLSWQQLARSEKALDNACCCAIILANSIKYYYYKQSHKLLQISDQLKDITTDGLNTLIRSGWLDLPNIESSLQVLLDFQ